MGPLWLAGDMSTINYSIVRDGTSIHVKPRDHLHSVFDTVRLLIRFPYFNYIRPFVLFSFRSVGSFKSQ